MPPALAKFLSDYGFATGAAIVLAILVRMFLLEAYRIPSPAMHPTLEPGDTVFVAKWPFGMRWPGGDRITDGRLPQRGEVVILTFPEEPSREYIKRVVGLPGDLVQVDQGKLKVNGQSVTQQVQQGGSGEICGVESLARGAGQIRYPVCWEPPLLSMSQPVQVGKDEVFVLGDSRGDSTDSRRTKSWGVTKLDLVKGKALFVWMSVEPPGGGRNGFFSRLRMNRFFLRVQ